MLSHLILINILHYDHTVLFPLCAQTQKTKYVLTAVYKRFCVVLTRPVLLCDKKPNPHLRILNFKLNFLVPSRHHLWFYEPNSLCMASGPLVESCLLLSHKFWSSIKGDCHAALAIFFLINEMHR